MFTGLMIGMFLGAAATWLGLFIGQQKKVASAPLGLTRSFSARIRSDREDYEAIERHGRLPYTRNALSAPIATD